MKYEGAFNYFLDGESKTIEDIRKLANTEMTVSIIGLNVFYNSSKKQTSKHKKCEEKGCIYCYVPGSGTKPLQKEEVLRLVDKYQKGGILEGIEFPFDHIQSDSPNKNGSKESEGKLFYELDFEFIKQMAERMQSNKDNSKYEKWNWKKPMTPKGLEDLKQAMWRHIIAVMQGEFEDDGREFGHLEAISNNAMMINYQLKNK